MRWPRPLRLPQRHDPGEVLIEARGICLTIGGFRILDGVDLSVRAGELVALVGPNGAGKSTLFNVLSGDLAATSGSVRLGGAPLEGWSLAELAVRRAVLPQHVLVTFPFRVADIVRMGRAPWYRTPESEFDEEAINEACLQTDIAPLTNRQYPSLSGGERGRVALARVLAQRTQLLLLDEPTAALDVHHQELALTLVRERVQAGDGALVALHDLSLAAAYADRIVVLARGRVASEGAPADVFTPSLLSSVYQHEMEVILHPATSEPLVLPLRRPTA